MEFRGLWFKDAGVVYGELHDVGDMVPGDIVPGRPCSRDVAVVALDGAIDMVEMYELDREIAIEDIEEADICGTTVNRGVGELRGAPSRRAASAETKYVE